MDVQLKGGMLEICVLAVLNQGESYGYQMIKDLTPCIEISESTLYPILKRLEKNECVTVYTVEHNSRLRKYYRDYRGGAETDPGFSGGMERNDEDLPFYTASGDRR